MRHFLGRGFVGKAMVVSIDKATALRMHDKVKKHWAAETERVQKELATRLRACAARRPERRSELRAAAGGARRTTDMALIVSPGQNEIEQMKTLGLDIEPHRKRMNESQPPLDEKFKDTAGPAAAGVRLRHVADGLRCAELLDDLSRQADAEPHADADHRPGEPGLPRQAQRRDRGLRQRVRLAGKGAGDLRRGQGRQESGQGQAEAGRGAAEGRGTTRRHSASSIRWRSRTSRSSPLGSLERLAAHRRRHQCPDLA